VPPCEQLQLLCSTVHVSSRPPRGGLSHASPDQALSPGQARLRHVAARKYCHDDRCWMSIMQGRGDVMRCTRLHSFFCCSDSTRQSCSPTTSNLISVLAQSLDARQEARVPQSVALPGGSGTSVRPHEPNIAMADSASKSKTLHRQCTPEPLAKS
jgi:hypothetical protein